ncbi:unnamed protein product [Symbiodinium microadriaticum]|nr:unnamed protein product [Symbiodinium microadriaticum]
MSSDETANQNHIVTVEGHHVAGDFVEIDLEEEVPDEAENGPQEPSDSGDSGESTKPELAALVGLIERMQPTRPEILRAVPTYHIVARLGRVFWSGRDRSFFSLSKVTQDYDEFLSHSWQVAVWKKVLLLLVIKNGLASVVVGTLTSLLMVLLWQLDFLPGFPKLGEKWSCWCSFAGLILALFTLAFWRPRGSIFVDRVCINQFDPRMKAEGIVNIGAVLRVSKSLLVLFDDSYADRLWCLFEMAAFLKAHPEAAEKPYILHVKPILLGFIACTTCFGAFGAGVFAVFNPFYDIFRFWGVLLVFGAAEGMFLVHAFRKYYRSLEAIESQLQDFRLRHAECWCCSVNHIHPASGMPIEVCDREIVSQCVTSWFGSEQEFDESVRSLTARALEQQLGYDAFPYLWMLGSFVPVWWPWMDYLAVYSQWEGEQFRVPYFVIRFLAFWLFCMPLVATVGIFFARCLRRKAQWICTELFLDALVCVLTLPSVLACVAWQLYTEITFYKYGVQDWLSETLGSVLFAAGCGVALLATRKGFHFANKRLFKRLGG